MPVVAGRLVYNVGAKSSDQGEHFYTRCLSIAFTFATDVPSRLEKV